MLLVPTPLCLNIKPLAQAIWQEEEIRGIDIKALNHKLSLFVDDIVVYLDNLNTSFNHLIQLTKGYGNHSDYKINVNKTKS